MAEIELLERDLQSSAVPEAYEEKLALEMERVLKEAEEKQAAVKAGWGYRIPFAGVRYYTF